jgi:hypothetical protein
MATRSTIAIKNSDGIIESIYCHWDGDSNGQILKEHYSTEDRVRELISHGNASYLEAEINPKGEHSFEKPENGVCVFYGRDRGESGQEKKKSSSFREWKQLFEEYNYLFVDGAWHLALNETNLIQI